jgi:hypothetical protein
MSTPLFFPAPQYREPLDPARTIDLRELCRRAGVTCKASGSWIGRRVAIDRGRELAIAAEPGGTGVVRVRVPAALSSRDASRWALSALAYGLMDVVARESIRGADWARPLAPRGRPATGTALSNRERQRAYRRRRRVSRGRGPEAAGRSEVQILSPRQSKSAMSLAIRRRRVEGALAIGGLGRNRVENRAGRTEASIRATLAANSDP